MKRQIIYFTLPSILLILFAYLLQTKMLLSGDVGYLLNATNQLLAGGQYGREIFETNPPMILYLYSPVIFLTNLTTINIIYLLPLYITLLTTISLFCSYLLLKKIFAEQKIVFLMVYYMLIFILFFLPAQQYGQREHLLMLGLVPYLFSAIISLEQQKIHPFFALGIGLAAGLGIALKPFFLVTPIFIELYFIWTKRNLFGWIRIESIAIMLVLVLYLCSVYFLQHSYIKIMLPLIADFYFIGTMQSWYLIFSHPMVLFCLFIFTSYFIFIKRDKYKSFSTVLMLAIAGMTVAFLIPRTPWYYHLLPALGFSCLLLAYYVSMFFLETSTNKIILARNSSILFIATLFFFTIPLPPWNKL